MVGLFEQWEKKNPYNFFQKKLFIDLHFNEWNKYLTPSQNIT